MDVLLLIVALMLCAFGFYLGIFKEAKTGKELWIDELVSLLLLLVGISLIIATFLTTGKAETFNPATDDCTEWEVCPKLDGEDGVLNPEILELRFKYSNWVQTGEDTVNFSRSNIVDFCYYPQKGSDMSLQMARLIAYDDSFKKCVSWQPKESGTPHIVKVLNQTHLLVDGNCVIEDDSDNRASDFLSVDCAGVIYDKGGKVLCQETLNCQSKLKQEEKPKTPVSALTESGMKCYFDGVWYYQVQLNGKLLSNIPQGWSSLNCEEIPQANPCEELFGANCTFVEERISQQPNSSNLTLVSLTLVSSS